MNTTIDNSEQRKARAPRVLVSAPSPKQSFLPASFGNESKINVRDGGAPSVRAGLAYAREGARTGAGKLCAPRKVAARFPFFI